jgi:hypothetical protein
MGRAACLSTSLGWPRRWRRPAARTPKMPALPELAVFTTH